MSERFPREYDRRQHQRLYNLYGERLPALERIRVRRGLHDLVDHLFAQLGRLPDSRGGLRVLSVETKAAGWLEIVTTGTTASADEILADAKQTARATCEHCGDIGRMVIKVGMEALVAGADIEPFDRLLCLDCAQAFQNAISRGKA